MATCTKCGTEIGKGEKFCPSCGTPASAVVTAAKKTTVAKSKSGMEAKAINTKIGVSAGLVAAAAYFLGIVGGWVPVVLVAGYVLLTETNEWLRMSVVKAVAVCVFFAVILTLVGLIPNTITIINNLASIFNRSFSIPVLSRIITAFNSIWSFFERLLLLLLGFRALQHDTISFGPIDGLIEKHTLGKGN